MILGQEVEFSTSDTLHRVGDDTGRDQFQRPIYRRLWKRSGPLPYRWARPPETVRGVIVGVRTLSDGRNEYYGSDEPIAYYPERYFEAYLVAFDLRRKPVYVLAENLTEVD